MPSQSHLSIHLGRATLAQAAPADTVTFCAVPLLPPLQLDPTPLFLLSTPLQSLTASSSSSVTQRQARNNI